jgi:hypothetical protein
MAGEEPKNGKTPDNGKGEYGEGNYAASRDYNERTRKFMEEKGDTIDEKAEAAEEALDGPEGEILRKAEEEGKSHAKR